MTASQDLPAHAISGVLLRSYLERIENHEEEKKEISERLKDVFAEAKAEGFDLPTLRQLIRLRKIKKEDLIEQQELLDLYRRALGD